MAESSKVLRQVLLASVHPLVVTRVELEGVDAIVVDASVLASAGLLPHEKVDVLNLTTGARLSAAVQVATRGAGVVELSGPAGHFAKVGDRLVVSAWGWMKEKAALRHEPRRVRLGEQNKVVSAVPAPAPPESLAKKAGPR